MSWWRLEGFGACSRVCALLVLLMFPLYSLAKPISQKKVSLGPCGGNSKRHFLGVGLSSLVGISYVNYYSRTCTRQYKTVLLLGTTLAALTTFPATAVPGPWS